LLSYLLHSDPLPEGEGGCSRCGCCERARATGSTAVTFGFRVQYGGQSLDTFSLLLNSFLRGLASAGRGRAPARLRQNDAVRRFEAWVFGCCVALLAKGGRASREPAPHWQEGGRLASLRHDRHRPAAWCWRGRSRSL